MATAYPSTFPAPLISGFSMSVASGVIRAPMEGAQSQRRVFSTMPHVVSLSFAMSLTQWATWQPWVKSNAYGWFSLNLPSMYAGLDDNITSPTLIRFISPVTSVNMSDEYVQLSVAAEFAPSMIARFHENT